jgi:DNA-binding IclR family transcriptional regulator
MLPAQPNQSLIDGLAVLQAVVGAGEGVGSRELARRLGLEATRVNRLLRTLAALGLARQDEARKYGPGAGVHVLAATALFGSKLLSRAVGPVERLRNDEPGLTVALGVRWRREVAYLLHVAPGRPLAEGVGRTGLFPAERSSIGRVLLAGAAPVELAELYGDGPGVPRELKAQLVLVRKQGWALVMGGAEPTLAVPVGPADSPTAGLAVAGALNKSRVKTLVARLVRAVQEMAA